MFVKTYPRAEVSRGASDDPDDVFWVIWIKYQSGGISQIGGEYNSWQVAMNEAHDMAKRKRGRSLG